MKPRNMKMANTVLLAGVLSVSCMNLISPTYAETKPSSIIIASAGGHGEGNGGDAYVQEFTKDARAIQAFLATRASDAIPSVDATDFLGKINHAKLSSVDEVLYLDGVPKDLINYPREQEIVISRPRWASIPDNKKMSIVVHEMFGLMGLSDRKYEISSTILEQSGLNSISFVVLDPSKVNEWSTNFAGIIKSALAQGYLAGTALQEKIILTTAIQSALQIGTPRFQKNFVSTLNAALADIDVYSKDLDRQVYLLRNYMSFALDDLSYINNGANPNDNGPYASQILRRALSIAALSKTDVEELDFLDRAIERAQTLFVESDNRRTETYACAQKVLMDATVIASDETVDIKTKIQIMRSSVAKASELRNVCK